MVSVLITRPQELSESLAVKLQKEGFETYIAPMLEYKNIDFDLDDLNKFDCLVFTSQQAVKVFANKTKDREFKIITVGDATAEMAKDLDFKNVLSAGGSVNDLQRFIGKNPEIKNILYFCAKDVAQEIVITGVNVNKIEIYSAEFIEGLAPEIVRALREQRVDKVLLLSPRTAKNLINIFKNNDLVEVASNMEAICLSENIAQEAQNIAWKELKIAGKPVLEEVLKVLKN